MDDHSKTMSTKNETPAPGAPAADAESRGTKRTADDNAEQSSRSTKKKWDKDERKTYHKGDRKGKGRNLGRGEYFRTKPDKREKIEKSHAKNQSADEHGKAQPIYSTKFSKDEITSEDRRPKRKVAVMIGYSGTGYKGMQIMPNQRTIEGDLFQAFVKAGAISKANADDPKKSQLIRCARTDKGVHAAGNVISLKLIIEDPEIVEKINNNLPEQIRVWGYERTTGSFSSYAQCDSRWYEYLIPTFAFLPPHPTSWMAKELKRIAEEDGKIGVYNERQKEVLGFWDEVEEKEVKPLLEAMDSETRALVEAALKHSEAISKNVMEDDEDEGEVDEATGEVVEQKISSNPDSTVDVHQPESLEANPSDIKNIRLEDQKDAGLLAEHSKQSDLLEAAIKTVKNTYIKAKNAYRIQPERVARIRDVLSRYEGTHNYHNFTIKKSPKDASAKRFIRSFQVNGDPVLINGSEWLSLKVHGQSFMMHQIRKMVAMVALIVRTGCDPERIPQALATDVFNIPKAPGLGLLLERPIFETYNQKAGTFDKNPIAFDKFEKEMLEFKQREIYDKIFQEEASNNVFHTFFAQIENYREPHFLFLSTRGIEASKGRRTVSSHTELSRKQKREHFLKNKLDSRNAAASAISEAEKDPAVQPSTTDQDGEIQPEIAVEKEEAKQEPEALQS